MRPILLLLSVALCSACDDGTNAGQDPDPGQQATDVGLTDGGEAEPDSAESTPDEGMVDEGLADAGADSAVEDDDAGEVEGSGSIEGVVYEDTDGTDRSTYDNDQSDDDVPLADVTVRLIGETDDLETQTDAEGNFSFPDLAAGVYMVRPDGPDGMACALRNCTGRFADAIESGSATLVVYGDSVPVVGDRPFFPSRLADLFEPLADIDVRNIAVAGSTSPQWLPGTANYTQRLLPEIADADLILVSIGGNDIVAYAANPARLADIPAAIAGAVELIAEIADNIVTTRDAILEINPTVDVGFLLYVDYSRADMDQLWRLASTFLGAENIQLIFESALAAMPTDDGFVLVDLFNGSQDQDVNALLFDQLHFNARGQTFYAEEIFKALGGVLVGASPLGDMPRSPLGLDQTWSFSAP